MGEEKKDILSKAVDSCSLTYRVETDIIQITPTEELQAASSSQPRSAMFSSSSYFFPGGFQS